MATLDIELFWCERYRPLAGWSPEYLLPTDQHAFRARGKKGGWPALEAAETAMLAPGWAWEEVRGSKGELLETQWEVEPAGQAADADGWSYGVNFNSSYEGSSKQSIQMFCRWQRRERTQTFASLEKLIEFADRYMCAEVRTLFGGCLNCDMTFAEPMGRLMLESLASASLYSEWSLAALVKLKQKMLQMLVGKVGSKVDSIEKLLAEFVDSQKGVTKRFAELFKGSPEDALRDRMIEVESHCPQLERDALAVIALKRFRPGDCCQAGSGEHECLFKPVKCPNRGCSKCVAARSLDEHIQSCHYTPAICEKCGEEIPRGEMKAHRASACPLRESSCHFCAVGCSAELAHRDLPKHLEDCTQAHVLLLLQTVLKQQEVMDSLSNRVNQLEKLKSDTEAVQRNQVEMALKISTLEKDLAALDKREAQDVAKAAEDAKKKAEAVKSEANKSAESGLSTLRTDLGKISKDLGVLKASAAETDRKMGPLHDDFLKRTKPPTSSTK